MTTYVGPFFVLLLVSLFSSSSPAARTTINPKALSRSLHHRTYTVGSITINTARILPPGW
jgi:hypothetical protein